jgi:diaminopimelate decarboxylase
MESRHSTERGSVLTEISQEGTKLGDKPRCSHDVSASSGHISDQSSPKMPKEYLNLIHEKSKYLTINEHHGVMRVQHENFNALQETERSRLQSPLAQSFLRFLGTTMPEKTNQGLVDSLRETLQDVTKREKFIKAQLKNYEEQVKFVEEWVKKAFGEQLERLPDQLQYLKSEWEQTHREVSSHQERLREAVNSAQCFDDILSASAYAHASSKKFCSLQFRMLNFMDHEWHKEVIEKSNRINNMSRKINDIWNITEKLKKHLSIKGSAHLENQLKNADFYHLDLKLRVEKELILASTTEPNDVNQRVHCMQNLQKDIETYEILQRHLDSLLGLACRLSAQSNIETLRDGSSFAQDEGIMLLSSDEPWDTTIRMDNISTAYHYNPLQITDKQISLLQDYIKRGDIQSKHILDTSVSIGRYNEMSYAFSGEQNLKTQINYAIKSQSNKYLLQDLMRNGLAREKEAGQSRFGMDAASAGEIEKCIDAAHAINVKAWEICSRITLSNPNMLQEDMAYALTNGVRSFVVHNKTQLDLLYKNAKKYSVKEEEVEIITRIPGPPNAKKTGGAKFGADLKTCENILLSSRRYGMKPTGMAVHVGWQVDSAERMEEGMNYALRKMAQTFKNMEKHGIELSIVDLGGGWPNQFRGKPVPSISENAAIVRELMDKHFGDKKPALILEPGNYLSAAAGITKANIINIDEVPNEPGMLRCVLDVGIFNGGLVDGHYPVSMIIDDKSVEALVSVSPDQKSQHRVVVFGPSCDSSDKVIADVMLSDNPRVHQRFRRMMEANNADYDIAKDIREANEHFIVLHGAGAYTSEYNVGKVGERGFNSIRNPDLVIISQGRVIF